MKRKLIAAFLIMLLLAAAFTPAAAASPLPFADVAMGDWFFEEVAFVYNGGLMSGTSADTFTPNGTTTRGMIVTILHRMAGLPGGSGSFADVHSGAYYADAVAWASGSGIVGGYGNGFFGPNDPITREQLASILYRYAQNQGRDISSGGSLSSFADEERISAYAVLPMKWAVGEGLISGVGNAMLDPAGTATRAQVAVILTRFCKSESMQPEPEEKEDPSEPQVPAEGGLTIAGKTYSLGMDASELPNHDEILPSVYGFKWYVFGSEDYTDFFAAGVRDGKVAALAASGDGFTYEGLRAGDRNTQQIKGVFADQHDGGAIHGVLLLASGEWECTTTDAALYGESRMLLHLTNAFRLHHGQDALAWCDAAAESARLHSVDMADHNYFAHDSRDGTKFYDRMKAQGITMVACGENIAASSIGMACFEAYHGWVNSLGHREVMLGDYTHLGIGGGYHEAAAWSCCYTQDFYRQ